MFQTQQNVLTPAMDILLRGMAALYNQAKNDGKLDIFIDLACQTLWEGDPVYAAPQTPNTLRWQESAFTERGKVHHPFKFLFAH